MNAGRTRVGLTLIEVMLAIAVLAVGVLGAAGLQATALNASRTATIMKTLDARAGSEMSIVRGQVLDVTAPQSRACGREADGCTVALQPCIVDGAGDLDCTLANVADPAAVAITVTAVDGERTVTLRSLVLR